MDRSRVDESLARAHAAHPARWVDDAAFVAAIEPLADPDGAHVEDLFLAVACLAGQSEAIAVLEARAFAPARAHVARLFGDQVADDVIQRTRAKLLTGERRLALYRARGPLAGWVRVVAVREAQADRRAPERREIPHDDLEILGDAGVADAEGLVLRARYGAAANAALQTALRTLDRETRVLLRMHYLDGATIEGVASILGVSRATAARRLAAARAEVAQGMRKALAEALGVDSEQVDSILSGLAGSFEITLRTALATTSEGG